MTTSRRILILGGTSWLGGTLARIALERGHMVKTFFGAPVEQPR